MQFHQFGSFQAVSILLRQVQLDYGINDDLSLKYLSFSNDVPVSSSPLPDIDKFFNIGEKQNNGPDNEIRENIIIGLINQTFPSHVFQHPKWNTVNSEVQAFVKAECPVDYNKVIAEHKGKRGFSYDFDLTYYDINDEIIVSKKIEWKFNASKISDLPERINLGHPSDYIDKSFEDFSFDNSLPQICALYDEPLPDKATWFVQTHGNAPKCMESLKKKYKESGADLASQCRTISNTGIKNFLEGGVTLDVIKLNEYFMIKQTEKVYMMWKDGKIFREELSTSDILIDETAPFVTTHNTFICKSKSGNKSIKLLLRWKNGPGFAYPAFQIK